MVENLKVLYGDKGWSILADIEDLRKALASMKSQIRPTKETIQNNQKTDEVMLTDETENRKSNDQMKQSEECESSDHIKQSENFESKAVVFQKK